MDERPTIAGAPHPQRARGFGQARLSAILEGIEAFLERERAQLPLWLVAGFGAGIAGWFTLGSPAAWAAFLCLCAALAVVGLLFPPTRTGRAVAWFAAAAALGCALVWGRAEWIATPKLLRPVVTELTGRVVAVEQLVAKGDVRLLLVPDSKNLPPKVRVSAKVDGVFKDVNRGSLVRLRARLAPPPSMALPGSYDFSRDAWFKGIGGVGRVLGPVVLVKKGEGAFLDRTRERLGTHIRERLPGAKGGIAAALVTGDQNGVPEEDAEAMRRSGLTHLLSVSGLHIAAVIGAVMFLTLRLLALSETLALRFNLVLVSAAAGAAAGIFYTLLTGAQVPTVRSCVAALLVLAGIALGRDALSMRLLAVGALVVLLFRPEAIAGASFQFSFAAVAAIIALHSSPWARRHLQAREEPWWARGLRWFGGMIATGLAVEAALIPFALFHFHKAGLYGVGANILAIPLTTFVIMPLEAAALLSDAISLGAPLWALTGWALGLLLGIAHAVAGTTGAVATVASIPTWCFALFAAGGLWICLWVSPIRWLGLAPVAFAAIGTLLAPEPQLLITGDGRHVAVVHNGQPLLLRERSGDFIQDVFAEASGFDGTPDLLEGQSFSRCTRDACISLLQHGGTTWRLLATRSNTRIDWHQITAACAEADIVVSERWLPKACNPRWLKADRKFLEQTGGLTITLGNTPHVASVAAQVGDHPWAATTSPQ